MGLLFVAALGGTIHALNHAVDSARGIGGWDQTLPLGVLAALTIAGLWVVATIPTQQVGLDRAQLAGPGYDTHAVKSRWR